jgi:hypothetical protein
MAWGQYILNDKGEPIPEPNLFKWGMWIENNKRHVADETIEGVRISTVFLGLDHRFHEPGPPILWETMIFGGPLNEEANRCTGSREQAEAMHAEMVARVRASLINSS